VSPVAEGVIGKHDGRFVVITTAISRLPQATMMFEIRNSATLLHCLVMPFRSVAR
jgi:hypothetical protein